MPINNLQQIKHIAASRIRINEDTSLSNVMNKVRLPKTNKHGGGKLLSHQYDHAERIISILNRTGLCADTSPTGSGKTYNTGYVCYEQKCPALVFCPKDVRKEWYNVLTSFGCMVAGITNYHIARNNDRSGETSCDTKWYDMRNGYTEVATPCPWIRREKVKKGIDTVIKFVWNLPYKCFIVFDEEHVAKNTETQSFSFIQGAIPSINSSKSGTTGHKILLITATPLEKKDQLKSIMYFLGLIKAPKMNEVNRFFKDRIGDFKDMNEIHNYLYDVEKGSISSMPEATPVNPDCINDVRPITYEMDENATFNIMQKNKEIIAIKSRLKAKVYDSALGEIAQNRNFVEEYKIGKIAELAIDALTKGEISRTEDSNRYGTPYKRVGIFLNFKDHINKLQKILGGILGEDKVGIYTGDQNTRDNEKAFNAYNKGNLKVLILTIDKGGQSISLHDRIGDMETFVIISPPTSATKLRQVIGRHYRAAVLTPVTQVIVFTKGDPVEESIRNGLAAKLDDIAKFTTGIPEKFILYDLVKL